MPPRPNTSGPAWAINAIHSSTGTCSHGQRSSLGTDHSSTTRRLTEDCSAEGSDVLELRVPLHTHLQQ